MDPTIAPGHVTLARVDLGGHPVAVPVDRIVQVIPHAGALPALPRRGTPAIGMIAFRDTVVPLVDLRRWVDFPAAAADDGLALVLGLDGRMVAITGSAVHGVRRLPAARLHRLQHDDDDDEIFASAARFDDGGPVPVLEVDRLMALADSWVDAADRGAARRVGHAHAHAQATTQGANGLPDHACFAIGEARIALRTADTQALEPMPAHRPFGRGPEAFGIVEWRGAPLAVCDLSSRVPGAATLSQCPYLLVVARGDHAMGIGITEALEFRSLPAGHIGPLPDALAGRPGLAGVAGHDDGQPLWIVDAGALMSVTGLGAIRTTVCVAGSARDAAADEAAVLRNDSPWLVFEADGLRCVPATDVREIVRIAAADCGAQAAGTFDWRGRRLAMNDLRGDGATGDGDLALVIAEGEGHRGLRIDAVHAIVPPGQGEFARMTMMRESADCLFWGRGRTRRTARVVTLAAAGA